MAKVPGLRDDGVMVGGLVFLGRMLDKIRLHAAGKLPADYNRGSGFDTRCTTFLKIEYAALEKRTLEGGTDEQVLEWAMTTGRRPTKEEIEMWNAWISKRGFRDERTEALARMKAERGWQNRDDIVTYFDFHRGDEESD